MNGEPQKSSVGESRDSFSEGMLGLIRTVLDQEISRRGTLEPNPTQSEPSFNSQEFLSSAEFRSTINTLMEEAFQSVLPQLLKRLKQEIEHRVQNQPHVDFASLVNSEQMKEMLDGRFRQMMLFLKQDVIPKSIDKKLSTA